MLRRTIICSLLALLALTGVAFDARADGYRRAAAGPMIAPFSWTGFYVGAQVGYTWADADHTFSNGAPADNSNPQGGVFGGQLGYNLQNGALVYGIEADLEHTNVRGSFVNPTGITSSGTSDINWQGSVRGRLGFVHQHGLFYLTGGWAFGDADFRGGPAGGPLGGYSDRLSGWTLGAGTEWMISRDVTMRVEYRYTDFGSSSGNLAPPFPAVAMPVDLTSQTIRLGVSYKF
jgi:outer membrane immunogenic protein